MLLAVSSCRCGESIVFLFIIHYSLFITHLHNDFSRLWSMNGYLFLESLYLLHGHRIHIHGHIGFEPSH